MHANLVLFTKGGTQRVFPLSSEITVIGRRHDCDLRIPLKFVSRRHCQLSKNSDDLKIRDLNSSSGTFLNGKKISEGVAHAGDYLVIGSLIFQLQIDGKPEKASPPAPAAQTLRAGDTKRNIKGIDSGTSRQEKPNTKSIPAPQQKKPELNAADSSAELDLSDSFMAELDQL